MTEKQIDEMVDRFLGWELPEDFCPDCGISFEGAVQISIDGKKVTRKEAAHGWWPVGTNLFTADQAREMIKHLLGESAEQSICRLTGGITHKEA